MSLRSIYALHRAATMAQKGRSAAAASQLSAAMQKGASDPRLAIRRALVTGDYDSLAKAAEEGMAGRASWIFLAIDNLAQGDFAKGEYHSRKALEAAPGNLTAGALLALARFGLTAGAEALVKQAPMLPHVSMRAQGLILLAAERAIRSGDPANRGAAEREDVSSGPLAWALDLLDDLAVWIYWLISITLNLIINARNPQSRAVYWHVIEGDRLEGLRKNGPAMERFKKALDIKPDCVEALESMVKRHCALGEYQEAEAMLARLVQTAGEGAGADPSIRKWEADICFFLGRLDKARAIYESLEPLFPLSYIIPYRIGLCALAEGDEGRAAACFEKALSRINPGLLAERVRLIPRRSVTA